MASKAWLKRIRFRQCDASSALDEILLGLAGHRPRIGGRVVYYWIDAFARATCCIVGHETALLGERFQHVVQRFGSSARVYLRFSSCFGRLTTLRFAPVHECFFGLFGRDSVRVGHWLATHGLRPGWQIAFGWR